MIAGLLKKIFGSRNDRLIRQYSQKVRAINALAGHMDGVAESIKGMSVTINGRKAIGYIDDRMGRLTAAKVK